jgi:hypothetical protein
MRSQQKMRARKATWLAFGLIALSAASSYAQETTQQGALSVPVNNGLEIYFGCITDWIIGCWFSYTETSCISITRRRQEHCEL